jgi:hypothetical protein
MTNPAPPGAASPIFSKSYDFVLCQGAGHTKTVTPETLRVSQTPRVSPLRPVKGA